MEGTTPTTDPVVPARHDRTGSLPLVSAEVSANGADAEFTAFYRAEYERFVRVAYLIVGSEGLAEEIVQEAFVRVHGRWGRVDNPSSYLRTSVVNACRDTIRRRVRWRRREPVLASPASTTDEPDELFDALARLNTRQRAVVVLRYYGGLQEAEIAEAVGMKVGTVKSTLHRSIEQLRKEIER